MRKSTEEAAYEVDGHTAMILFTQQEKIALSSIKDCCVTVVFRYRNEIFLVMNLPVGTTTSK